MNKQRFEDLMPNDLSVIFVGNQSWPQDTRLVIMKYGDQNLKMQMNGYSRANDKQLADQLITIATNHLGYVHVVYDHDPITRKDRLLPSP